MNKHRIHGGELCGIILLMCIAIDSIIGLWIKSDILQVSFFWANVWVSGVLISIGAIVLVMGCVAGYISHEAFNQAVSPNGEVKRVLKDGLFKYTRHPFYLSLILITLSLVLVLRSWLLIVGLVVVTALLVGEARKEEMLLLELFGDEYLGYQQKTGMFFPKLFK